MTQKEFTDLVYDTLMKNTQHPQLDLSKVTDQYCDASKGKIVVEQDDDLFEIKIIKLN